MRTNIIYSNVFRHNRRSSEEDEVRRQKYVKVATIIKFNGNIQGESHLGPDLDKLSRASRTEHL